VYRLQETARGGAVDPATAAALAAAAQLGGATGNAALDALSNALGGGAAAGAAAEAEAQMSHDYEFSSVELVKPTRMNKVYLVFACSILEQDLMFVVYNIPTVGICRAEQRAKACQKLGVSYAELGGVDALFATDNPLGIGQGMPSRSITMQNGAGAGSLVQQQQQQRKRGSGPGWGDGSMMGMDGMGGHVRGYGEGLMGLAASGSDMNLAALAAGADMAGMGMAMQVSEREKRGGLQQQVEKFIDNRLRLGDGQDTKGLGCAAVALRCWAALRATVLFAAACCAEQRCMLQCRSVYTIGWVTCVPSWDTCVPTCTGYSARAAAVLQQHLSGCTALCCWPLSASPSVGHNVAHPPLLLLLLFLLPGHHIRSWMASCRAWLTAQVST
jgi:hypothetical protein